MKKHILGITAALALNACAGDRPIVDVTQPARIGDRSSIGSIASDATLCTTTCTVGPLTFVRDRGTPVVETIHFSASPGPFIVDVDNLGSQGADAYVELNGTVLRTDVTTTHQTQTITLANENTLIVRLAGKPGSELRVAIWPSEPPAVLRVSITPPRLMMLPGDQAQLTANVQAVGGAPTTVTWSVSGLPVVTVSPTGFVTAVGQGLAPGPTSIVATSTADPTKSDAIKVNVYDWRLTTPSTPVMVATAPSISHPTSVDLVASVCGTLGTVQENPFFRVDFTALSNGAQVFIGTGTVTSTDFPGMGMTFRCWNWQLTWTPGAAFWLGQQTIRATAVGLPVGTPTLSTPPNTNVTTVIP